MGTSNQTFIFNSPVGLSFTNLYITLSGGVTANNVFFNVTGTGHSVSLTNSNLEWNVLGPDVAHQRHQRHGKRGVHVGVQ